MNVLIKLFVTAIALYFYLTHFMDNISDRQYAIPHKLYLFIFTFIVQFLVNFVSNVITKKGEKVSMEEVFSSSINNALLAIIAFDVYNDLVYNKYYVGFSVQQQIMVLILLIIGFMASIKILELLITSN